MSNVRYKKVRITDENKDVHSDYKERYKQLGPSGFIYVSLLDIDIVFRREVRLSDEYIHEFSTSDWHTLMEFKNGIICKTNLTDDWVEGFAVALAI